MGHFTYLCINFFSFIIPFVFSFHRKLDFRKNWSAFFPACLIVALIFILWDNYFTAKGVWGFNPRYITGLYIGYLPIEEILFFICIPYSSVFTYHCLIALTKTDFFKNYYSIISFVIAGSLLTIAIFNLSRLYTSVTFILTAVVLLVITKSSYQFLLNRFYFTYLVILFPFFIVNGILTGSIIDEPVVWYNNDYNLGIRLLTIPIEDIFYGMLLLVANIALYEYFLKRNSKPSF